jgi:hypothetical protein
MTWNLTCRKVRRLLALQAGNDLDHADQVVVRRHLAVCPHCRERWEGLQAGRQALDEVRPLSAGSPTGRSLWPVLAAQIRAIDDGRASADWRDWLPAGALAAACITVAMLMPGASGPLRNGSDDLAGRSAIVTQAVRADRWSADAPAPFAEREFRQRPPLEWREVPVRTLLDGTDARGR